VPRPRPIHQPNAHRSVVGSRAALHETTLVSPRHARPQIALVLHLPRHDRRAGASRARGGLRALGNDDLVVHVLVDHVQFVNVLASAAVLWWYEDDDSRCRALVYTNLGQLNPLGIEL
jgi:hypothetical protein